MENGNKINQFNWYLFCIIFFILAGCILRILFFSYNRPMWNDECALAINLREQINYFVPLVYNQAAPQLFMYLSKVLYTIFHEKTFSLRIIPFITSILSIFLFYNISAKILVKKISIITAMAIFSLCYPLCYYAQEFKQYSSDIFCFLLILLSYFYTDQIASGSKKLKILYGIGCSILIWFSFTSIFALFSLLISLLIFHRERVKQLWISEGITAFNLLVFTVFNFQLNNNEYLHQFWADSFINAGVIEFFTLNIENIKYIFGKAFPLLLIVISLFLIFFKKQEIKKEENILITIPLFLTLVLSYFEIYPYSTRLILFLIPIFILLCTKVIDFITFKNKIINYITIGIIISIVICPVFSKSWKNIIRKKYGFENIQTLLSIALADAGPNDVIYISEGSEINFKYYKKYFKIKNEILYDKKRITDESSYIKNLNHLKKGKTYYWIISHLAHPPYRYSRINTVINWAKDKNNFNILHTDKTLNTLIKFSL